MKNGEQNMQKSTCTEEKMILKRIIIGNREGDAAENHIHRTTYIPENSRCTTTAQIEFESSKFRANFVYNNSADEENIARAR